MTTTLLLHFCFVAPVMADTPADSIAIVDLRECLKHAPTAGMDKAAMVNLISETDAEAGRLVKAMKAAESQAEGEDSTELQRAKARLAKLEFDSFRLREGSRIQKTEGEMFQKWRRQVDFAVRTVAQREGFTIVLYLGEDDVDTESVATDLKAMLGASHVGFVSKQERTNITAKIIAEMSTTAFWDAMKRKV